MSNTELESALASLAVDHNVIDGRLALDLIKRSRTAASKPLAELIREHTAESDLLRVVADELGYEFVDLSVADPGVSIDSALLSGADIGILSRHSAVPMVRTDGSVLLVMGNPNNLDAQQYVRTFLRTQFSVAIASVVQVQARLLSLSSGLATTVQPGPDAVPEWIDGVMAHAMAERASDILFRFMDDGQLFVRIRVDGVLWRIPVPEAVRNRETEVIAAILGRSATIDAANIREPQDGTFSFSAGGRKIDVRIGLLPQVNGANVTLRLLDSATIQRRPEDMGLHPAHIARLRAVIREPQGCVIVVGPTGSGKTTTLYALLREVDSVTRNVLTVEDPVEYQLPYIGQTQIRSDLGERSLTWAKALRSILRNDPDVVLVGEVRDDEVAKTAMEAAITGHMVLTTLHAQSAPGAFLRLQQMGVQRYLLADAVSAVISQRLLRRVHECCLMEPPTVEEQQQFARWGLQAPERIAHATGCHLCAGTGYRGRFAVAELLIPDQAFRDHMISPATSAPAIRQSAARTGWEPIIVDSYRAVCDGRTTVAEMARVVGGTGASFDADVTDADVTNEGNVGHGKIVENAAMPSQAYSSAPPSLSDARVFPLPSRTFGVE